MERTGFEGSTAVSGLGPVMPSTFSFPEGAHLMDTQRADRVISSPAMSGAHRTHQAHILATAHHPFYLLLYHFAFCCRARCQNL